MSRPILLDTPPRDARVELRSRLEDAPTEHAEALLAAYEVLQGLHDKGVLEIMRGALGSSDKVIEIAVEVAKSPASIRGIRNLVLLVDMLGSIDPEELAAFTRTVPLALNSISQQPEPPGLWRLTKSFLRDRDIRRGLSVLEVLLKTLGSSLARDQGHH